MGISGPQRDISPYISNAKAWPTRPFTLACLWPVASKDVYSNRGQVQHYMDVFGASLVLIIFTMVASVCEQLRRTSRKTNLTRTVSPSLSARKREQSIVARTPSHQSRATADSMARERLALQGRVEMNDPCSPTGSFGFVSSWLPRLYIPLLPTHNGKEYCIKETYYPYRSSP